MRKKILLSLILVLILNYEALALEESACSLLNDRGKRPMAENSEIRLGMMQPISSENQNTNTAKPEKAKKTDESRESASNFKNHDFPLDGLIGEAFSEIKRLKETGMSEKQIEDVNKIKIEFEKKEIQMDAEFKIINIDIKEMARSDVDLDKLENITSRLTDLYKRKFSATLDFFRQYFSLVSKDQRNKLKGSVSSKSISSTQTKKESCP